MRVEIKYQDIDGLKLSSVTLRKKNMLLLFLFFFISLLAYKIKTKMFFNTFWIIATLVIMSLINCLLKIVL